MTRSGCAVSIAASSGPPPARSIVLVLVGVLGGEGELVAGGGPGEVLVDLGDNSSAAHLINVVGGGEAGDGGAERLREGLGLGQVALERQQKATINVGNTELGPFMLFGTWAWYSTSRPR